MSDESNVCMTCDIVWVPKEAYSAALAQIETLTRKKAELVNEVADWRDRHLAAFGRWQQEVNTLRAELSAITREIEDRKMAAVFVIEESNRLRAELDASKEKAARYDWLTDGNAYEHADADQPYIMRQYRDSYGNNRDEILSPEDVAKEIDTARVRPGTLLRKAAAADGSPQTKPIVPNKPMSYGAFERGRRNQKRDE